jgi:hypothetical protein
MTSPRTRGSSLPFPPPVLGSDGVGAPVFAYGGKAYFCSRDLRVCGAYSIADDRWGVLDLAESVPAFADWPAWAVTSHELILYGSPELRESQRIASRYDFDTESWNALPTSGAPAPLRGQSATWIDHGVLFWGGSRVSGPAVPEQGWLLKLD